MSLKDKLIINQHPNSAFYKLIIEILDMLTELKWGYVRSKHRIKYATSVEFPILVGAWFGKSYEQYVKYQLDIEIIHKAQNEFATREQWKEALTAELQRELLKCVGRYVGVVNSMHQKILNWRPRPEFDDKLAWAAAEVEIYGEHDDPDCYDAWEDNCIYDNQSNLIMSAP